MGQRGPKRQPSRLQELRGNPGNRKRIKEAKPSTTAQQPPAFLQGASLEKWHQLSAILEPMGLLTDCDRDVLAMHCIYHELYLVALADVQKEGQVMQFHSTKQGRPITMIHPQLTAMNKLEALMLKTAAHFGMTPSSRLDVPPLQVHDPLAEFVGT